MAECYQTGLDGYYVGVTEDFGGYLPAGAVYDPPLPPKEGFASRWDGKTWVYAESHIGREGYLDGNPYKIYWHGPLPALWSDDPPPPTARQLAERRLAEINGRLAAIDTARSRPLADLALGKDVEFSAAKLQGLEVERAELADEKVDLETQITAEETA